MNVYLVFLLVTLAIGGVAWVFVYPLLSGERHTERRMASVARAEPTALRPTRAAQRSRREQVQGTLKEIEDRQKKAKRLPLAARISQAGLSWSKRRFFLTAGAFGFVGFFAVLAVGAGLLVALSAGFAAGCGLPLWLLSFLKKRRLVRFLNGRLEKRPIPSATSPPTKTASPPSAREPSSSKQPRPQVLNKSSRSVSWPRLSQIGYCRAAGFALVEPCSFMFKRSVISYKKPIGLPRSTAPDKNIRVFVAR